MAQCASLDLIRVSGFRSLASIEDFALAPLSVLIGANGSGKSNFLSIFGFLHEIALGRLQNYVRRAGGAEQLLHFGSKVSQEIEISIPFKGGVKYRLILKARAAGG